MGTLNESDSDSSLMAESTLHLDSAWSAFNECREKGMFCDAVIKIQDQKFPVHRVVLSTCSDYFRYGGFDILLSENNG